MRRRYWTIKLDNDPLKADYAVVTHSEYRTFCILHRYTGRYARQRAWRDARTMNKEHAAFFRNRRAS